MPVAGGGGRSRVIEPSTHSKGRLFVVGVFPPPMTGMSAVNEGMLDALSRRGGVPIVIRLNAVSLIRKPLYHLRRLASVVLGYARFAVGVAVHRPFNVYMSVSGGYGQLYELGFLVLARLSGGGVFLHHHNFGYLNRLRLVTTLLCRLAGPRAVHVVACEEQGHALQSLYPHVRCVAVVSNAAFVTPPKEGVHRKPRLSVLGYFGNVSFEKGVMEFLEVMRVLQGGHVAVKALLAGPIPSRHVREAVSEALRPLQNTEYVGPKHGLERAAFFESVDALLYPSHDDCAPLTIYEALSYSVPVIAADRGCIGSILRESGGHIVAREAEYAQSAAEHLEEWANAPEQFRSASQSAGACFAAQRRVAEGQLAALIDMLVSFGR